MKTAWRLHHKSLWRVFVAAACFLGAPSLSAQADTLSTKSQVSSSWKIISSKAVVDLGHGVRLAQKKIAGPHEAELHLIYFNSKNCDLKVVDQVSREKAVGILAFASRFEQAIAICNAGYFTPEFEPVGLVISESQRYGTFQRSSLLGGFVQVKKGRPMLLWRDEYAAESGVTDLLQAGPRLVVGGQPIKGLEDHARRQRTFIATDNDGQWLIGICYYASLRQLSDLLCSPAIITEMEIDRALNLDGGGSTCMWWRNHHTQQTGMVPNLRTVRNFLVVLPKNITAR